jgi:MazG family protein
MRAMSDAVDRLREIMDRLRDPGGCPWDREQTLATLAPYLLEEAHEVAEAVAAADPAKLCEELGDLLLQIVFMARIGTENGWFDLDDVAEGISAKMVRRHPHVFGDRQVADAGEVLRNWEDIKRDERAGAAVASSALDGVPAALPALLKAFRMTEKAAAVGFDWRRPVDVMVKMREEMTELESELEAGGGAATDRLRAEMGDVLFVMANLARHLGVEPETALQRANASFKRRFESMEAQAGADGRSLRDMSLEEQDALWEEAKRREGRPSNGPRSR